MKVVKVLFLVFLFIVVCFSLYHIETKDNVSNNSYFLAIVAIIIFVLCFLLLVLKIKVGGQYIQLEQDLANFQAEQKRLTNKVTALYKLLLINSIFETPLSSKALTIHKIVRKEIEKSVDLDDINKFINTIDKLQHTKSDKE